MVDSSAGYHPFTCEVCFENTLDPTRTGLYVVQQGTGAQANGVAYTNLHDFTLSVAIEYLKHQCNYNPATHCLWFAIDFEGVQHRIYIWCDQQWQFSFRFYGTRMKYFIGEMLYEESSWEHSLAGSVPQEELTATRQSQSTSHDFLVTRRREGSPGSDAYVPTLTQSSFEEEDLGVDLGNETAKLILQSNESLRYISTGRPVSLVTDLEASNSNDPDNPASQDLSAIGEHRASSTTGALPVDTVPQSAHSTGSFMANNDTVLQKEVKRLGAKVQQIERAVRAMGQNVDQQDSIL
ncbi:hypothetical protein BDV12DRAFT_181755 [Aspergillus spectabilis]